MTSQKGSTEVSYFGDFPTRIIDARIESGGRLVLLAIVVGVVIGDNIQQLHHVRMIQLAKDFDLTHRRNGKALLLVLQTHLLQRHQHIYTIEAVKVEVRID